MHFCQTCPCTHRIQAIHHLVQIGQAHNRQIFSFQCIDALHIAEVIVCDELFFNVLKGDDHGISAQLFEQAYFVIIILKSISAVAGIGVLENMPFVFRLRAFVKVNCPVGVNLLIQFPANRCRKHHQFAVRQRFFDQKGHPFSVRMDVLCTQQTV